MSSSEWKIKRLSDLTTKIGSGATPKGGNSVYIESGIPFIRSQNIYNCEFVTNGLVYINEEQAKKLDIVKIERDDILLNITGDSVARCTKVPVKHVGGRVNQHVAIIRANKKLLEPEFLKYYLISPNMQSYMLSLARMGGTRAALTKGMIESFDIPVPIIQEQKAIAHILSTLDEKIEVNNQINKTLEAMAQAIFKHWFVDFEFPNEDGEPYQSSGGEMVESELGMIPKGWEVKDMTDICSVKDGTHASPKTIEIGYPLITSKHLMGTKLDFPSAKHISKVDFDEVNRRSKVDRYDILISMIGTVGNIYLVQNEEINFAIKNVGLFKTSECIELYEYIYCYLKTELIQQYIKERMAGSTQQYISLGELRNIPVIFPSNNINLLRIFKDTANAILKMIYINAQEIRKLEDIRDTLLPKLMSGEIRVPIDVTSQ